jgi:hypothetical protein
MCERMVKDTLAADRKAAEAWRFHHVKSKERQLLEAGWRAVVGFLHETYGALRAKGSARPAREQPVY